MSSAASTSSFTEEDLSRMVNLLKESRRPMLVGIVCQPRWIQYLRRLVDEGSPHPNDPLPWMSGVSVYEKHLMTESHRCFFDRQELRDFLED